MNHFNDACTLSCDDWLTDFSESYEYEFSNSFDKEMKKLIDKMRNDKYHRLTRKTMLALIAAAIVLAFATTVFAVPSSKKHIIQEFKNHFSYTVADINEIKKVKDLILGYVPYGFEKTYDYYTNKGIIYEYTNENSWFNIEKSSIDTLVNTDVSDKRIDTINGIEYCFYHTESTNGVIWNNGLYVYVISGNIEKEELIKIALETE